MPTAVIMLAAGQGTRMNSDLPKALHVLAGAPLVAHALAAARPLEPERIVVVVGHGGAAVAEAVAEIEPAAMIVTQDEQRGTGHAALQAAPALADFDGDALVLYADTPLLRPEALEALRGALAEGAAVAALGFEAADPGGYGRMVLDEDGELAAIIEARDADPATRAIRLCNSGVLAAPSRLLFELIGAVRADNSKGEIYLTGIVALARGRGLRAAAIACPEAETLGVNTREDLAAAEAAFQARARAEALANGVTLADPGSVWFALDTVIGRDVTVGPSVYFGPGVTIETGARINAFCHLEGCHVSRGAVVGPFARLRPGADLAEDVRVGNFVEIKAAAIEEGAKVNHLAYIGDARVGARANVGAGAITCNYDGVFKHRTEIGAGAFVGSNSALVAPVRVGARAVVAAGSVITADVPDEALALARARQAVKPGLGARLMARLRAIKAAAS